MENVIERLRDFMEENKHQIEFIGAQNGKIKEVNALINNTKPNAKNTQGGIVEKEAPIHISNLMLVENKVATRIGRRIDEKTGKLVRYSKKSGEVIK